MKTIAEILSAIMTKQELIDIDIWEIEVRIGLLWCTSVRDKFRHMWE